MNSDGTDRGAVPHGLDLERIKGRAAFFLFCLNKTKKCVPFSVSRCLRDSIDFERRIGDHLIHLFQHGLEMPFAKLAADIQDAIRIRQMR